MAIKHDRSATSVVTRCTECGPAWQAFSFDITEAYRRGAAHLELVHGVEPARAREAGRKHATRRTGHMAF